MGHHTVDADQYPKTKANVASMNAHGKYGSPVLFKCVAQMHYSVMDCYFSQSFGNRFSGSRILLSKRFDSWQNLPTTQAQRVYHNSS